MINNKVFIISQDRNIYDPLQKLLQDDGMEVSVSPSIADMFEGYIKNPCVLSIVDAKAAGAETLNMVKYLHGAKPTPILVLSGDSSADRLTYLQTGASVCLDVDLNPTEQVAQARALIQIYGAKDDTLHRKTLVFGTALAINPVYRAVVLNGEMLTLTRREFDLLHFMAKHNMQVLTEEQIYKHVWNDSKGTQVGDTVKSAIKTLRKKMEPFGRDYIQNVWGIGYRFVGNAQSK